MCAVVGYGLSLSTEEELVMNCAADGLVDVGVVVDEVRELEVEAVLALVWPAPAEAHVGRADAGAFVEVASCEPSFGARSDTRATFRDQPHLPVESLDELGDCIEGADHLWCGEQCLFVSIEEGGVASVRVGGPVDDDTPDVDAEPWYLFLFHGETIAHRPLVQNY